MRRYICTHSGSCLTRASRERVSNHSRTACQFDKSERESVCQTTAAQRVKSERESACQITAAHRVKQEALCWYVCARCCETRGVHAAVKQEARLLLTQTCQPHTHTRNTHTYELNYSAGGAVEEDIVALICSYTYTSE
jgi:hypothetical protein